MVDVMTSTRSVLFLLARYTSCALFAPAASNKYVLCRFGLHFGGGVLGCKVRWQSVFSLRKTCFFPSGFLRCSVRRCIVSFYVLVLERRGVILSIYFISTLDRWNVLPRRRGKPCALSRNGCENRQTPTSRYPRLQTRPRCDDNASF